MREEEIERGQGRLGSRTNFYTKRRKKKEEFGKAAEEREKRRSRGDRHARFVGDS